MDRPVSVVLEFTLPDTFEEPASVGLDPQPQALQKWLDQLPLTDAESSSKELIQRLGQIVHARVPPNRRLQLTLRVQPVVDALIASLRERYSRTLLPLPPKARKAFETAVELHRLTILALKVGIHDMHQLQLGTPSLSQEIIVAVELAMYHLGQLLLEWFLVYRGTPEGVWAEAHRLYQFAETHHAEDVVIPKPEPRDVTASIAHTYRGGLLLSMSNPYHLMQEEALSVYRLLPRIFGGCELRQRPPDGARPGYVVDLKADAPPRFTPVLAEAQGLELRHIDLSRIIAAIKKRITALSSTDSQLAATMPRLARHMQRDMLGRLLDTWGRTSERRHQRSSRPGRLRLHVGLSAAHHALSDNAPFMPELDEIRIHTGRVPDSDISLKLMPLDSEPWKMEETLQRFESGISDSRSSDFDADSRALDIWEKVYATRGNRARDIANADGSLKPLHASSSWEILDQGEGGMRLRCEDARSMPLRVGDVIAYRRHDSHDCTLIIGTIRWVRLDDDQVIQAGVMRLYTHARPVALRAVQGIGKGGEYFRGLVVPAGDVDAADASLLAPATIYDVGSVLAINVQERIHYAKLTRLLRSSNSFTQYSYKIIDTPASEIEVIDTLRTLV